MRSLERRTTGKGEGVKDACCSLAFKPRGWFGVLQMRRKGVAGNKSGKGKSAPAASAEDDGDYIEAPADALVRAAVL
jgi:hypothetical protein